METDVLSPITKRREHSQLQLSLPFLLSLEMAENDTTEEDELYEFLKFWDGLYMDRWRAEYGAVKCTACRDEPPPPGFRVRNMDLLNEASARADQQFGKSASSEDVMRIYENLLAEHEPKNKCVLP